jgi:hypothetical protein
MDTTSQGASEPSGPNVLPGDTADRIRDRSDNWILAGGVCALPIFVESKFQSLQPYYAITFFTIFAGFGLVGMRFYHAAWRKAKQEKRLGYTSMLYYARRDPSLYVIGSKSKRVLARPNEPRPMSRGQAWLRGASFLPRKGR